MARSATTTDVFNAIGEGQRRDILGLLALGERSVNEFVDLLEARQRLYKLNPEGLKPVHDWVKPFEVMWNERLDRLDDYLQELQQEGGRDGKKQTKR